MKMGLDVVIEDLKSNKKQKTFKNKMFLYILPVIVLVLLISTYFLIKPSINLNGSKEITISYSESYQEEEVKAKFLGKDISKYIKQDGHVEEGKIGKYVINYDLKYFIFHNSKTRIVKVVDEEKPTITLTGETTKKLCPSHLYEEEGYVAFDEYDGDITSKVIKTENQNEIIYEVEDSSHNKVTIKRNISYQDDIKPEIILKGLQKEYVNVGNKYNEKGYTAIDNCEGDITSKVEVIGTANTSVVGKYELTYQVMDSTGNTSSVTREVNVVNKNVVENPTGKTGVIYLTFDDGPSGVTSKILDILKEEDVKATFFVTNNGSDSLIKRAASEGHTIALHTASHQYAKVYSSVEAYFEDLKIVHDRVERLTGIDSKYVRFPGGSSNTVSKNYTLGIMTTLTNEVLNRGYRYYDWNVSSGDAGGARNANDVYNNVTKNLSKNRVNMVLMHDTKGMTRDALKSIIRYGKEKGYVFERITDDTPMVRHGVNN